MDAARLLGVNSNSPNPVQSIGVVAFVYLIGFVLARIFCAVGLWINSSWGAVVLVGATATELGLVMFGNPYVSVSVTGFIVRTLMLLGGCAVLTFVQIKTIDFVNR